ncbi:TetR/AcrR family transcriptional regulator [Nocardioides sp. 1609]|uniref:TetR/AcrR family transcriptional regulator n=1 Tax=Nocardioides sp. 1609 TaxID=2508327 RepID=UPI00142FB783|nr:TetR/AcrR family transcriptional regulator [Nocardioides sp. 1609]
MTTRKYELRQRAADMDATRDRITQAAIDLHGTIGPVRTTISAIAQRAGVQRITVTRHFPDDADLFAACSGRYWADHPLPDPAGWAVPGPDATRGAFEETYRFYASVEPMLTNVLRDATVSPLIEGSLDPYRAFLDAASDVLLETVRSPALPDARRSALRWALSFETWFRLHRLENLSDDDAAALALELLVPA